jgi:hypothetical protein
MSDSGLLSRMMDVTDYRPTDYRPPITVLSRMLSRMMDVPGYPSSAE